MSRKPTTWAQEVRHAGLNKRQVVQGPERRLVEEMAAALGAQWDADWERLCEAERGQSAVDEGPQTDAAVAALASLSAILLDGLNVENRVDREGYKEQPRFAEPKPIPRAATPVPSCPDQNAQKYQSRLGLLAFFSGKRRRVAARAASEAYERDRAAWSAQIAKINADNEAGRQDYAKAVADWEARRARHLAAQRRRLQSIDDRARGAIAGRQAGIAELFELARVAAARLVGPSPVAPL